MTTLALNYQAFNPAERTLREAWTPLEPCSCGLALAGHGPAYNEEAFHHFLAIERNRSEASMSPFLLLLVEFEKRGGVPVQITNGLATKVFSALTECLRDTDVIGWYREDRIAGAVLTDLGDVSLSSIPQQITSRVQSILRASVPAAVSSLVQVRIYQLPARGETMTADPHLQQWS
jgi:hypothetical protein